MGRRSGKKLPPKNTKKKKQNIVKLHKFDEVDYYAHERSRNQRHLTPELIEYLTTKLDWHSRRAYMAYDMLYGKICVFFPEAITENELYHYLEIPINNSSSPLAYAKEIQQIVKLARAAGRKRRSIW